MDSLATKVWFPFEEICLLNGMPLFVKRQRQIARLGLDDSAGCFSVRMLESDFIVRKGLKGLDPEHPNEPRWLVEHPGLSPEERRARGDRFGKAAKGTETNAVVGLFDKAAGEADTFSTLSESGHESAPERGIE
jgi:hypothetical protein